MMVLTMNSGSSAFLAVVSSTVLFFCALAIGAVNAGDLDLLVRPRIPLSSQGQRQLLSYDFTAMKRGAELSPRATATVDTTAAMSTAAALTSKATCNECQWQ